METGKRDPDLEAALACVSALDHLMAPVSMTVPLARFAELVAEHSPAEACSVYLRAEKDPTRLELAGFYGYHDHLDSSFHYRLDPKRKSFTTSVFKSGEAKTYNKTDLQKETDSVPRCEALLKSGEFRNVGAAAIIFRHGEDGVEEKLGVLKVENRTDSKHDNFNDRLGFLQLVADFLALAIQQWRYAFWWTNARRQPAETMREYSARLAETVAKIFYAEIGFAYVRTAADSFQQEGAFGSGGSGEDAIRSQVDRLVKLASETCVEIPFKGDGAKGELKNAVVIPVCKGNFVRGVLVAGNLRAAPPDPYNIKVAKAFANHVSDSLAEEKTGVTAPSPGYLELVKTWGPPGRLRGMALRKKVNEVSQKRAQSSVRITGEDCAAYLQISRTYYLKLAQETAHASIENRESSVH